MSIKKQALSGVKWTTVSTITLAVSALVKVSVLARFLEPSDFGLMALITLILGFMDLFMDMGITSAILHRQYISKKEYASLYWLNVMFSLFLFMSIVGLSPFIASFYNELQLIKLIPLAALVIVFSAVGRQYKTILQKKLYFKTMAIVDILSVVISLIFAVIFAVHGYGVYALVYSSLIQYGINNSLYFIIGVKNNPIMFHYKYFETKPFLKIGVYQVGGQVVNYINRDLDVLIIGKFFGADVLGGYSLAKQLSRRPLSVINPIINRVAISILPRYQEDNNVLKKYFNKLIRGLSFINAFVYGSIAIAAPLVISVLYGDDYLQIMDLVRLFAVVFYFRSVSSLVGILSVTKGRTDLEFYWNILIAAVMPIVIFVGVNMSVSFIVFLIAIAQFLLVFPSWYMFYFKQIRMPLLLYSKGILMPFLVAGTIYMLFRITGLESSWFQVIASGFLFVSLAVFFVKTDKDFLNYLKNNKYINRFNFK